MSLDDFSWVERRQNFPLRPFLQFNFYPIGCLGRIFLFPKVNILCGNRGCYTKNR